MKVEFINRTRSRIPRKFLSSWLKTVEKELRSRGVGGKNLDLDLTVVFLGRRAARELNRRFRGRDRATDILSFSSMDPEGLGDLVLCMEVIRAQATRNGLPFRAEASYLLLHGVLHLLGFEHEGQPAKARRMYALQDAIFAKYFDIDY